MSTLTTLSHTTPVPCTEFLIFGVSDDYAPQHREQLHSIATDFGAAFADLCFVVHRRVFELHDDYAAELLAEASNHGLLPS